MEVQSESASERPAAIVARHGRLARRTVMVSLLTLVSRVLGLVREVVAAILFGGQSPVFDGFLTAWRIPNLMRRLFGEGALATSLTAALTVEDHQRGDAAGRRLFGQVLRFTTWVLTGLCALAMVALYWAVPSLGSGWLGEWEGASAAVELTLRLLPFVVWICLAALAAGALNVRGHFFAPTAAPVVMNLIWIAGLGVILFWRRDQTAIEQVRFLTWVVLLAGASQFLLQLPALWRHRLMVWSGGAPEPEPQENAWSIMRQSLPLALGAAVYQVNVMVDGLMAEALLPTGAPTAQYYANRIQQFPLALVASAATASIFPALKALAEVGRPEELRRLHDRTQWAVAFLALPATVGLFLLAPEIASALFQHGKYGPEDVRRLSAALATLALALFPVGAVGLASRVYYSKGDFSTPVRISVIALVLNTALNLFFVIGLGMDVEGLGLGTALASWANLALLLPGLQTRLGLPPAEVGWRQRMARQVAAALCSGAAGWGTARALHWAFDLPSGAAGAALALGPALLVALLVQLLAARALGLDEWRSIAQRWSRRR